MRGNRREDVEDMKEIHDDITDYGQSSFEQNEVELQMGLLSPSLETSEKRRNSQKKAGKTLLDAYSVFRANTNLTFCETSMVLHQYGINNLSLRETSIVFQQHGRSMYFKYLQRD